MSERVNLTPDDLGIDVASGTPQQLYRWFLASILFGKPIQQGVAAATYRALLDHGLTSPAAFDRFGREPLRRILDGGGYGRFDYQMADYLHEIMPAVKREHGSVRRMVTTSADRATLERRMAAFTGVGKVTARIFAERVPARLYGTA